MAPIPVCTPPEEAGQEQEEEENSPEDEASAKENKKFLTENPGLKDLILKIEDMLLDFWSTNQKATQDNNYQFQQGTNELIDVYPVSKTKDMYKRYQAKFLAFARETNVNIDKMVAEKNKLTLDNFITKFFVVQGMVYCPSSLYVIYSCINHWFISTYGFKLNGLLKVNRYLKAVTSSYVCKKSKVFSPEEIDSLLMFCQESTDPEYTFLGVGVALMYYGLLRKADVNKIQIQDVSQDEKGRVKIEFAHSRKRKNPGFSYLIPSLYQKLFLKYESELSTELKSTDTYLRRYTKVANCRETHIAGKTICKLVTTACEVLHKDPVGYTVHAFRRSAATNLADAGVSFVNLKRHGQWKSDSVAEGYIANSKALQHERVVMLLPEHRRTARFPSPLGPPGTTFKDPIFDDMHRKKLYKESKKKSNHVTIQLDSDSSGEESFDPPLAALVTPTRRKKRKVLKNQQAENEVVFLKTVPGPSPGVIDVTGSAPISMEAVISMPSCSIPRTTQSGRFVEFLRTLGEEEQHAIFHNCTFHVYDSAK